MYRRPSHPNPSLRPLLAALIFGACSLALALKPEQAAALAAEGFPPPPASVEWPRAPQAEGARLFFSLYVAPRKRELLVLVPRLLELPSPKPPAWVRIELAWLLSPELPANSSLVRWLWDEAARTDPGAALLAHAFGPEPRMPVRGNATTPALELLRAWYACEAGLLRRWAEEWWDPYLYERYFLCRAE